MIDPDLATPATSLLKDHTYYSSDRWPDRQHNNYITTLFITFGSNPEKPQLAFAHALTCCHHSNPLGLSFHIPALYFLWPFIHWLGHNWHCWKLILYWCRYCFWSFWDSLWICRQAIPLLLYAIAIHHAPTYIMEYLKLNFGLWSRNNIARNYTYLSWGNHSYGYSVDSVPKDPVYNI